MKQTAKEFLKSTELIIKFDNTQGCILEEELPNLMIEFAKLHVEACKKEQKSKLNDLVKYGAINETWEEVQKTIESAYSLTLIK